jgi:hypothetical protein
MSEYRAEIKNRMILLALVAVLSVAFVVVGVLLAGNSQSDNGSYVDGLVKGFPVGLFSGFCALMLFQIVRCWKALSKES